MLKDKPVLEFNINENIYNIMAPELMPYRMRYCLNEHASSVKDMITNYNLMVDYLSSRILDLSRTNAKKILNAYHYSQEQSPENKARIAIACKTVSMNDSYWIKTFDSNERWSDVDPKHNSLSQIVANILLVGESLTLTGKIHNPEFTNKGAYPKCWIREDEPYLYKASTNGEIESEIEISVSKILDCFNVNHATYLPATYQNNSEESLRLCKSKNIATDNLDMLTAEDFSIYCNRKQISFIPAVQKLDSDNFYKMCIVDYLISNSDRHNGNWGFYVDNNTGNIKGLHPLYDHNNAFDKTFMKDGGESLLFQGKTQEEVAKYAINRCAFENIKPLDKAYFLNDEMYESFCKNAEKLNLRMEKTASKYTFDLTDFGL